MAFGNLVSRRHQHHPYETSSSSKITSNSRQPRHRSILTYHHRPPSSNNSGDLHRGCWRCRSVFSKVMAFVVLLISLYAFASRHVLQVHMEQRNGLREAKTHDNPLVQPTPQFKDGSSVDIKLNEKIRLPPSPNDIEIADASEDGASERETAKHGPQKLDETMDKEDKIIEPKRRNKVRDDDTDDERRIVPPDHVNQPDGPRDEEISQDESADNMLHHNLPEDGHMSEIPPTIEPKGFAFTTADDFERHRSKSEAVLKQDGSVLRNIITAYIEPPLHDTVPNTGSRGDLKDIKDKGIPPDFVRPLPRRTHSPNELRKIEYPAVQTCHDMPGKFPVDRGLEINEHGEVVVWNVGNKPTPPDFPEQEAPFCPVELDPFLPWIHDVFPSQDGSRIEFIAQNKRRCRTGVEYTENVNRLVPQVALMQPISVEKISEAQARELAPDVWHPPENLNVEDSTPRYRLASYEESSPNGRFTRFICRFHMTTALDGAASVSILLGETLSEFPFNYEYINYRKDQSALLTPKGKDTLMFWTSNIRFSCPLPENTALRQAVANGKTVLKNGAPTVFVDVIPIRTSVRYNETYLTNDMIGPTNRESRILDPEERWGPDHVLPRVEASGRWANIPICLPPELVEQHTVHTDTELDTFDTTTESRKLVPNIADLPLKPHFLVGCLWASAEFKTRGKDRGASTDTIDRLKEWIEFHLMVGFDHIYVYDNSGAHTNETSLEQTVALYPGKVTRIDWPSIVCNNNIPAHDSTGERSSQYAAENSCRTRYGPFTEWLASFDTDEYFVPMGNYTNLPDVLRDVREKGTNILSLRSSRGCLRRDKSDIVGPNNDAYEKSPEAMFLEAYNCDSGGIPKPDWADRARKQIYRPDYVLYHFVHYSTVTKGYLQTYRDAKENGQTWNRKYREVSPSERASDELSEVVMVHTKSLGREMTFNFNNTCRFDREKKWQQCWVAYPWPLEQSETLTKENHDENGMEYNCYINQKVENYWVPKLREALQKRRKNGSR